MKKVVFFLGMSVLSIMAMAQSFQPMNGDFEQWDSDQLTAEPTHWNSFATSTGTYAALASSPHHYHRRNNNGTNSYLTIYTKSIVGVKANGNMTTGRIYAGSMNASSSSNYNYTERGNSDFSHPFTATPDSMYVWVSFYAESASSVAQITTYIHGDCDFKDPGDANNASAYTAKAIAQTTRTTTSGSSMSWVQLKVPFNYTGTAAPAYLLISMTTNMNPGGGAKDDSLSIDDIQFVYSSWLADIKVNGATIDGFSKDVFLYDLGEWTSDHDFTIEAFAEVADVMVAIDSSVVAIDTLSDGVYDVEYEYAIRVTAEDGNYRDYTVRRRARVEDIPQLGTSDLAQQITISPNPTSGVVMINGEVDDMSYTLTDITGKRIAIYEAGTRQINLGGLPNGLYILHHKNTSVKIMKQ